MRRGLPGGFVVMTQELHTARPVEVIGFYPRTRSQRKRAADAVALLEQIGLRGWIKEETA